MRRAWVVIALAACEPALRVQPLPELVAQAAPQPIAARPLLVPGEQLRWDVRVQGLTIGRAELMVDGATVRSRFATTQLASALANVRHELTTVLAGAGPARASELVELDGARTRHDATFTGARIAIATRALAVPGGNLGHTLHSALGVVRAWAAAEAPAGYLYVLHAGELFRLELAQPHVEELHGTPALRIDGRIRGNVELGVSVWLRARDRVPLRCEVRDGDVRVVAELIDG